jgi:hypothetical protein
MAREVARRCKGCGYQWFAQPQTWRPKPSSFGSAWSHGASTGQKYLREQYDAWKHCPRCNSTRLETVTGRDAKSFAPTAAQVEAPSPSVETKQCGCGASLSPAWRFCPMCASPVT